MDEREKRLSENPKKSRRHFFNERKMWVYAPEKTHLASVNLCDRHYDLLICLEGRGDWMMEVRRKEGNGTDGVEGRQLRAASDLSVRGVAI